MGKERRSYGQLAASGALQPDSRLALTAHVNDWSTAGDQYHGAAKLSTLSLLLSCARRPVNCRRKLNAKLQIPSSRRSPHKNALPTLLLRKQQGTPFPLNAYPKESVRGPDVGAVHRGAVHLLEYHRAVVGVPVWQPCSTGTVHDARCPLPIQGNGH